MDRRILFPYHFLLLFHLNAADLVGIHMIERNQHTKKMKEWKKPRSSTRLYMYTI